MTDIRILTQQDRPELEQLLWQYADTSLFMLGNLNLSGIDDNGKAYEGTYLGAFENGKLVAVIVRYWNGNCMPQGEINAVLDIWQQRQLFTGPINGFVGRDDLCSVLRDLFLAENECSVTDMDLNNREVLYRLALSQLKPPQTKLMLRLACEADFEFLLPWMLDYNVEALNATRDQELAEHCHDSLLRRLAVENCFVLFNGEQPVATTGFNARVDSYIQVGGVFTPKDNRGKGYAQAAVAQSLQMAQAQGYTDCILFTDEENHSARTAYENIGFKQTGHFGLYLLKA